MGNISFFYFIFSKIIFLFLRDKERIAKTPTKIKILYSIIVN